MRVPFTLGLLGLAAAAVQAAPPAAPYAVAQRLPLGGNGGWDYPGVDAAAHRLYLSRADHVVVVDTAGGEPLASIADTPGVHGIALAPALNRGFISCGAANQVKVFDLKTNAVLASVAVGEGPDAILFEPYTARVFAFNGRGHSASVIDARSNALLATIALGGKPEFARADGHGGVLVNIEDTAELAKIDAKALALAARWSLPQCEEPSGLALDAAHRRSFSTCGNRQLVVFDYSAGKAVATLPIGSGVDGAEYDPAAADIYAANGEGSLTVIHQDSADRYRVVQTLATQRGARTIALDPATHRLYLPTAEFGPLPPPQAGQPRTRPPIVDGSFSVLVVAPAAALAGPP